MSALPNEPEPLIDLLSRQHGVLSRAQARAYGWTRSAIRAQLTAQRWQVPSRRVIVTHNGPLTWLQRCWVALLHTGTGAALAGPTASQIDGLKGYEDERVHVVAPPGARVPAIATVPLVLHHSRLLDTSQVHPLRTPARTRIARSLVDMATWTPDPLRACAVLAAGVQQRLVVPDQLRTALNRPGPLAHHRALLMIVDDIEGGSHSLAELNAVRLCRRAGLPPPARQLVRLDRHGRRRYLDLPWPEYATVAEIDGSAHRTNQAWWEDMDRQNEIAIGGERVLRFPAMVVRLQPERFLDQVRRALRRGGWPG